MIARVGSDISDCFTDVLRCEDDTSDSSQICEFDNEEIAGLYSRIFPAHSSHVTHIQ